MGYSLILVGFGGGVGSMLRYLMGSLADRYIHSPYPYGTFAVNVAGCLLIGILIGLTDRHIKLPQELKYLFISGFCGGFTTFSAFAAETMAMLQAGRILSALFYTVSSVVIGLFFLWAGAALAR